MKKWLLTCSTDAINIDYSQVIGSESEPEFWDCYAIAENHGCGWFMISEVES